MRRLRYTLVSDGSSDRALMPLLKWLMQEHMPDWAVDDQWADFTNLRKPPRTLDQRITQSLKLYPCDLLIVHRDAERAARATRVREITRAIHGIDALPQVCFAIPVRMMEAWFLFHKDAIREASGNRNGTVPLLLPPAPDTLSNPKRVLYDLLRDASERGGRKLKKFKPDVCLHRLADLIRDYSPLRCLRAFVEFEDEMKASLERIKVNRG
jgi:hypothetical protein